jgi:hypothetical protein
MHPSMLATQSLENIIFATVIGIVISSISNALPKVFEYLFQLVKKIWKRIVKYFSKEENRLTLTSVCIKSSYGSVEKSPTDYKAVLHRIHIKRINIKEAKMKTATMCIYRDISNDNNISEYNIDHNDQIILDESKDIRVYCTVTTDTKSNDKESISASYYHIHLLSTKLTITQLMEKVNKWRVQYNKFKRQYVDDDHIYYYRSIVNVDKGKDGKGELSRINTWMKHTLESNKRFDNVFFEGKDRLLNRLNLFLENEAYYRKKGIPYTLGMLFYGDPGCGKTSCIKAISNHTGRHIMEINLRNVKTCGEFVNLFTDEFIEKQYIPFNKRIIVIEDIDCMHDIVKQRTESVEQEEEPASELNSLAKLFSPRKYDIHDKLSLSCILNVIDGILEQPGRILIITTNFRNKIDSALLRRGRVDIEVNFRKCTSKITREILEHFYEKPVPNVELPELVISPADLMDICMNNQDDMDEAIHCLLHR